MCLNRASLVLLCTVLWLIVSLPPVGSPASLCERLPHQKDINSNGIHACIIRVEMWGRHLLFFFPLFLLGSKWKWGRLFFEGEENKSLSHNNNPLSRKTGLAVSQTFMFLQSCAVKCVTSAQLTFVVIGPWQSNSKRHTHLLYDCSNGDFNRLFFNSVSFLYPEYH